MTRETIATNLRRWMKATPALSSQPRVAEKSGVGQTTIGRILRQEVSATVEVLSAIAGAFGRTTAELTSSSESEARFASLAAHHGWDVATVQSGSLGDQVQTPDFRLNRDGNELFILIKPDGFDVQNARVRNAIELLGQKLLIIKPQDIESCFRQQPLASPNVAHMPLRAARSIPVIGYVQAGLWTEATDSYAMGSGSEMINTDLDDLGPNAFALRIKGDSNSPDYKEGEIVIIDPSVTPIPGDMVVAKNGDEEATFKKYRPRGTDDNGKDIFELVPLNDDYPTLRSDRDGPMRIIGTMVEHRRFRRR